MTLLLTATLLCAPGLHPFEGKCLTEAEWTAWPPLAAVVTTDPPLPAAAATSPYRGMGSGNVEQWRSMVAYFWGKHGATDRMLRIMRCESGGDPDAYNRSGASGLFQIMPFWKKVWPGNYFDPWTNAAVAYQIWLTQGFRAWVCK